MRRCSSCLLRAPAVGIPDEGVCYLCRSDDHQIRYLGEAALLELLDHHKMAARRRGAKHDCLVAISGGQDSMYALHQIVTKYGLHPLAFCYQHVCTHEQAKLNVGNAVDILGVDLVLNTDDREQREYLRRNLRELPSQPHWRLGRLAHLLCTCCEDGYEKEAYKVAAEHKLSLIMQEAARSRRTCTSSGRPVRTVPGDGPRQG